LIRFEPQQQLHHWLLITSLSKTDELSVARNVWENKVETKWYGKLFSRFPFLINYLFILLMQKT